MTIKESQIQLVKYRLKQAEESISEANHLLSGKESTRSIINRLYYSMFYSVLALLVFEPYTFSKHSGVISYFNKTFIKEGIFQKDLGRWLNRAFEMRQESDYREYVEVTYEEVAPYIEKAENFLEQVKNYLSEKRGLIIS